MHFTVEKALEMEVFQKCRLLTGQAGLQNKIRWVNILEILDDLSHIEPGEFLITTAHGFNAQDKNMQRSMIELFASRKLAAMAIQTGHYIKDIPSSFISFSEEYDIPLIEIPPEVSFKSITRTLLNELIQHEQSTGEESSKEDSSILFEAQLLEMKQLWRSLLESENPEGLHVELERYGLKAREPILVLELNIVGSGETQSELSEQAGTNLLAQTEKTITRILLQRHISFLVGPYDHQLVLLIQANQLNAPSKSNHFNNWDLSFCNQLLDELKLLYPDYNLLVGSSSVRNNIGELKIARQEAEKALHAAKLGLPDGSELVSYKKLGLYRLIMDIKNLETLKETYNATIAPLLDYDHHSKGALLKTLKVYLDHFNIKKAAEEMFVHRHTMRYRLRQIEQLTGYDPIIPSHAVQLNVGLHIYYYLERLNLLN